MARESTVSRENEACLNIRMSLLKGESQYEYGARSLLPNGEYIFAVIATAFSHSLEVMALGGSAQVRA
jgi:hypothetical protein